MQRLVHIASVALLGILLAACSVAVPLQNGSSGPIKPGDKVGDVTVTQGEGDDILYQWDDACTAVGDFEGTCTASVGQRANVSMGVFDETFSGKLDELWAAHTYEMSIDDRPVDLKAFGSVDVAHPMVLSLRAWNVVLVADKPAQVEVQSKGVVHGEPFTQTLTYTFSQ